MLKLIKSSTFKALQVELVSKQNSIDGLSDKLMAEIDEKHSSQNALVNLTKQYSDKELECENLKKSLSYSDNMYNVLNSQHKELKAVLKSKHNELETYKQDLLSAQAQIASKDERYEALGTDWQTIQNALLNADSELATLRESLANYNNITAINQETIQRLQAENTELRKFLDKPAEQQAVQSTAPIQVEVTESFWTNLAKELANATAQQHPDTFHSSRSVSSALSSASANLPEATFALKAQGTTDQSTGEAHQLLSKQDNTVTQTNGVELLRVQGSGHISDNVGGTPNFIPSTTFLESFNAGVTVVDGATVATADAFSQPAQAPIKLPSEMLADRERFYSGKF